MSKKNIKTSNDNIKTTDELLREDCNYGLYTIINNITRLSGSIMREPDDKTAYDRAHNDLVKALENNSSDKLENFSLIRLGVYNIETSTIINIDRLVMPFGEVK